MSSTADRADLISEVEDHLRGVAKVVRRAMLDAMPDGEPVQWLYGPMREYPSRPGKAVARIEHRKRPVCTDAGSGAAAKNR